MNNIGYIYLLTSPNNKKYVGQTVNINKRWNEYKSLKHSLKRQPHLYNALKKYGSENFTYELIDICYEQDELDDAEKYWIKYYDSINNGYNIKDGGRHGCGITEEGRKKLSIKSKLYWETMDIEKKKELIEIVRKKNIGKKWSDEAKRKISLQRIGRKPWNKGIPQTTVTTEKIRKSILSPDLMKTNIIKNIINKYEILNLITNKLYKFYSLSTFCKMFNLSYSSLKKAANKQGIYKNYLKVNKIALDQTDKDLIKSNDDILLQVLEC